eukprot:869718-Amphidinium_carterae.1
MREPLVSCLWVKWMENTPLDCLHCAPCKYSSDMIDHLPFPLHHRSEPFDQEEECNRGRYLDEQIRANKLLATEHSDVMSRSMLKTTTSTRIASH